MSRRGGRRSLRTGRGASGSWVLDLSSAGTFTRSSAGTYLTAAPNSAGGFMSLASANVRRLENRGDGAGSLLLLEGERTNEVKSSRDNSNATGWALASHGSPTITANAAAGPDGLTKATRIACTTSQYSRGQSVATGSTKICSQWVRAVSGTTKHRKNFRYSSGTPAEMTLSTTWERCVGPAASSGAASYYAVDGTLQSASGDIYWDMAQVEIGRFPSSATEETTSGAGATRAADTLTIASASVPTKLLTHPAQFAQVSPVFAAADLVSGDVHWLLSIGGGSSGIRIRHTGTDVRVEAVVSSAVVASSGALSHSRHGLLGAVAWNPAAGLVSVNGVNGAAGTPWSWSAADVRIGGIYGGAGEAFCRLGALSEVA